MLELIGILIPAFIDLINRRVKDSDVRFWISVAVCAVVGIAVNYIQTLFVFPSLMEAVEAVSKSILVVFGLAQLVYKAGYENSSFRKENDLKAPNS